MKKNKLNKVIIMGLSIGLTINLSGCGNNGNSEGKTVVRISGSTSVGPIMEKVSEIYSKNNNVDIEINQVG